jgi:hypothetical protein
MKRMTRLLTTAAVVLTSIPMTLTSLVPAHAADVVQWRVDYQQKYEYGGVLSGIAAISKTDVWAVGGIYSGPTTPVNQPYIRHWNGTTWSAVSVPFTGTTTSGVAASSADNVWVFGQTTTTARMRVYQFDGQSWAAVHIPFNATFDDLAVLSPSDVWALGSLPDSTSDLFHWNGTGWTAYAVASPGQLAGLSATGPDNVWVTGIDAVPGVTKGPLFAYRWDGSSWAEATLPHLVTSGAVDVAAVAPAGAWIGGLLPSANGFFLQGSGGTWQERRTPSSISAGSDVVADGAGGVWLGPWAHWTGHAWVNADGVDGVSGAGILQLVQIPGTSSYWGAGAVTDGQTSTTYQPAVLSYGPRP